MSERMTSITLRTGNASSLTFADRGRKTRNEMIAAIRKDAERVKAECDMVLAAQDQDFLVETYEGIHVMKNRKEVK